MVSFSTLRAVVAALGGSGKRDARIVVDTKERKEEEEEEEGQLGRERRRCEGDGKEKDRDFGTVCEEGIREVKAIAIETRSTTEKRNAEGQSLFN